MPNDRERNNGKTRPHKVNNNNRRPMKKKRKPQQSSNKMKNHNRPQQSANMKNKKRPEVKKSKKNKFSNRHPKLMMAIKIIIVLFLLLCVIGAGIVVGMFFGLFGDDFEIKQEQLKIGAANSVVLASDGTEIANLQRRRKKKNNNIRRNGRIFTKSICCNRG